MSDVASAGGGGARRRQATHLVIAAVIWVVLTAAIEVAAFTDMFPTVGSEEAVDFDDIFKILIVMGAPVLAFVFAVLIYVMIAFRGDPRTGAGDTFYGRGMVPKVWLVVTGGLAALVMIHPGLTGLAHLQGSKTGYGWGQTDAELVVNVEGFRWNWRFEYPQSGVKLQPLPDAYLVLPVDTRIKFQIVSNDVVHSFWIPAFRMKIDAIPGRTTFFTTTPDKLGSWETDDSYRVQCAELCGIDHSTMRFPVRVVEKKEFNDWLASQKTAK